MDDLREELRNAKRALYGTRMQLARYGGSAPVHLIMEEEDLALKVGQLETALGLDLTEPRQLPTPPSGRQYAPKPAPRFEERMRAQEVEQRQQSIEHQIKLLGVHRQHLALLRAQQRQLGAHAPTYIQAQILERTGEIARVKSALRGYGYGVADLPGDE